MGFPCKTVQVRVTKSPIATGLVFAVSSTLGEPENYKCEHMKNNISK